MIAANWRDYLTPAELILLGRSVMPGPDGFVRRVGSKWDSGIKGASLFDTKRQAVAFFDNFFSVALPMRCTLRAQSAPYTAGTPAPTPPPAPWRPASPEPVSVAPRQGSTWATPRPETPRIFCGIFPAGLLWADRERIHQGDYKRLAFLPYRTLLLDIERDCPTELREIIESEAADIIDRRGEAFQVSTAGQTVLLGGSDA